MSMPLLLACGAGRNIGATKSVPLASAPSAHSRDRTDASAEALRCSRRRVERKDAADMLSESTLKIMVAGLTPVCVFWLMVIF